MLSQMQIVTTQKLLTGKILSMRVQYNLNIVQDLVVLEKLST